MRNPPTHTIALVNGRVQVIVKAGERTLRIHLFARVEDAEAFKDDSERKTARLSIAPRPEDELMTCIVWEKEENPAHSPK